MTISEGWKNTARLSAWLSQQLAAWLSQQLAARAFPALRRLHLHGPSHPAMIIPPGDKVGQDSSTRMKYTICMDSKEMTNTHAFPVRSHGHTLRRVFRFSRAVTCFRLIAVCCGIATLCSSASGQDRFATLRDQMVSRAIEAEGITNPEVLRAMRKVERHQFVPSNLRSQAYQDSALPIGSQQTISPPYIVAYMTETLDPQPKDRVLEIGTGSGYQAAVLAEIVADVYTIEIVSPLAKSAAKRLEELGYTNVHVRDGDGYEGWAEHAPYDRIIVTCSPEKVPQPLVDQLKEGGRMIIPVGERYQQSFVLLEKKDGKLIEEKLISTLFVPMTGESEDQREILPNPLNPQIVNGSFELDANGDDRVDGWHYQRQAEISTEEPMEGAQCLKFTGAANGQLSQALQGTAIDGRKIGAIQLTYWVRFKGVAPGPGPADQAAVVVHFYDSIRREVSAEVHGKWRGSLGWQKARTNVIVPPTAKEMIVRIGLHGATGELWFDDLQITSVPR